MYNSNQSKYIFGLDIGTRYVVGIVGYFEQKTFNIIACEVIEHQSRVMIDGQIHDIKKVSETILMVKQNLEKKTSLKLKNVAIAAAGRVLKTRCVDTSINYAEEKFISNKDIQMLHLNGIEQAQQQLNVNYDREEFFCVGYSVIKYYLNDYVIENLEEHKAKKIGAKVLATFLPESVVDSLYTAIKKADLEITNLSLEPIAAINVAIPKEYRLLNLALLDIGAGTSDIAITKEGGVVAYGMIPMAGDEITEQIVQKYLVDFNTAEKIKLNLNKESVEFKDIIGITHEVKCTEIINHIEPVLDKLSISICEEIKKLNGDKSPNAVFCVGGGGQVPGFINKLAEKLDLPEERVVLRHTNDIKNIKFLIEPLIDSLYVTPIGICVTTQIEQGNNFIEVILNNEKVKLLNKKHISIIDAAVKKGFNQCNLIPQKGKDLSYILNNKKYKIRGQYGEAAKITLNNKEASLTTHIHQNDVINIVEAQKGKDAILTISELIKKLEKCVYYINNQQTIYPQIIVNNKQVNENYLVKYHDNITYKYVNTISELIQDCGISIKNMIVKVNDKATDPNTILMNGDNITISSESEVREDKDIEQKYTCDNLDYNKYNNLTVKVNNEQICLTGKKSYIFVDVFEYIDFDLKKLKGHLILKLNNNKAAYTDLLKNNDNIEIYWDNK